jgi:hypothetical protein
MAGATELAWTQEPGHSSLQEASNTTDGCPHWVSEGPENRTRCRRERGLRHIQVQGVTQPLGTYRGQTGS